MKNLSIFIVLSMLFVVGCVQQNSPVTKEEAINTSDQNYEASRIFFYPVNYLQGNLTFNVNYYRNNLSETDPPINLFMNFTNSWMDNRRRWGEMPIFIYINSSNCGNTEVSDLRQAMNMWEKETDGLIRFEETTDPKLHEIKFSCFLTSIEPVNVRGEVMGFGTPTYHIPTRLFDIITDAEVFIYSTSLKCSGDIVEAHELGHALSFDHDPYNKNGLMYPETLNCGSVIEDEIKDIVKSLYGIGAKSDLYFTSADAKLDNGIFSIKGKVGNDGIVTSKTSTISIIINGEELEKIYIPQLGAGADDYAFSASIKNTVKGKIEEIKLILDKNNENYEFLKDNNEITLKRKT